VSRKGLRLKARVNSREKATEHLSQPGDAVIVDRQGPRWLIMSCPCGCNAEVPVNLDRRAGPAWRLYESSRGLSVFPSVWRDTDCKCHFIILRDQILVLGMDDNELWFEEADQGKEELMGQVRDRLAAQHQTAEEISDRIPGSVPWDVLRCCRELCRLGVAIEGSGSESSRLFLR
jgi:hypothetical protein